MALLLICNRQVEKEREGKKMISEGIRIGARLAFSEYPFVKIVRDFTDRTKRERLERDCAKLHNFTNKAVIESDGTMHRALYITGSKKASSVCSVRGEARIVDIDDYSKRWCPTCWPGIQRILDRYRTTW